MKSAFVLIALLTIVSAAPLEGNNLEVNQSLTEPSCGNPTNASPFYRLYNSTSVDHFYTLTASDIKLALDSGFEFEGVSSYIFGDSNPDSVNPDSVNPGSVNPGSVVPLYRLYSIPDTDVFYTTSAAERQSALSQGYDPEGIAGFIYPNASCGGVPFYRLYSASGRDHFYTTSAAERDSAARGGYTYEGITGYVYPY